MIKDFFENPFDLSNLRHVSPDIIVRFIQMLEALELEKDKKLIIVLGTGGTISMKMENEVRVPDLDCNTILEASASHLKEKFEVVSLDLFALDSSQMNYSHVADVAIIVSYIYSKIKLDVFIGFVLFHGTDTMAYSSACLSLMLGQGLPFSVVYTGAQKPIQEPMSDAINNVRNSFYLLDSLYENNMAEVLIAMGSVAVLGTSSTKVDDERVEAFDAPIHKYVAKFDKLEYPVLVADWLRAKRGEGFLPNIWSDDYGRSLVVSSALGLDPNIIYSQLDEEKIKAVIFYSYGASTVYKPLLDKILEKARIRKIPVFVVNPTNAKPKPTYLSAQEMFAEGVVPLFMTLPTALAKIEIAWRKYGGDINSFSEFMINNYVGEVPSDEVSYIDN